jgi:hypothetical protein
VSCATLLTVLKEIRAILARPCTDFVWSNWDNQDDALAEIDSILGRVGNGNTTDLSHLKLLFAPTSCLQELSLTNGWDEEYLELASRFDEAIQNL